MHNIALSMIIKDDTEAETLRRCLNSAKDYVQGIFLTGTKEPQEEIKKIAEEYGAIYSFFPWINDFAAARNFAYSQVPPGEYPWILWLDADDVLHGGANLQRVLDNMEELSISAVFAKYLYQVDLGDNLCKDCGQHNEVKDVYIEHIRERLTKNNGVFKWISQIHETLIAQTPVNQTDNHDFTVVHLTTHERMMEAIDRNILVLQDQLLREEGKDPRTVYYLAKAYFDLDEPLLYDYEMALLKQYLDQSGWPEERGQAWQYVGELHRRKNEHKQSILADLSGIAEWPQFPPLYLDLSISYLLMGDWAKAEHWADIAGNLTMPKTTLVISPRDMLLRMLEVRFNVYWQTGRIDQAFEIAELLAKSYPSELNFGRLAMTEATKRDNLLAHCVAKLAHHFDQTKDKERMKALLDAIPQEIAAVPTMVNLRNEMSEPKVWNDKSIAIYCGQGFEQWSPKSLDKGLGGSESAVIYLSRELAKLGWEVTVYGDPGDEMGLYDGVDYKPFYFFNAKDKFNVFIAWRQPGLYDLDLKAKKRLVWLHDIANPVDFTEQRLEKIDKIICLSQWHRDNLSQVPDEKMVVIGNGIPII